jgi:hypothetical protein
VQKQEWKVLQRVVHWLNSAARLRYTLFSYGLEGVFFCLHAAAWQGRAQIDEVATGGGQVSLNWWPCQLKT